MSCRFSAQSRRNQRVQRTLHEAKLTDVLSQTVSIEKTGQGEWQTAALKEYPKRFVTGLEAIASRVEAIASRVEAIACSVGGHCL